MREIKFRAWDKQEGCWLDKNHAFDYAAKETKLIYCDIEGVAVGNDTVYLLDECGNWEYLSRDRFELMQFTGLHDKNGKEIFEGDVVDVNDDMDIKDIPDIETMCDVVTMERFPTYWLKNERFGYEGEELISPEDTEIIGNIYENPELLKEVL